MPKGFTILEWTVDEGLVLLKKFPEDIVVDIDDMMRVFYAHITGAGGKGNVVIRLAQSSISSHFSGMEAETPYMINLILELGEDPEMFGDVIDQINNTILDYLNRINMMKDKPAVEMDLIKLMDKYIEKMFDFIQRLGDFNKEQKVAQIFCSPRSREIHKYLQEGPIAKKDLKFYLERNLKQVISNLEIVIDPFTETDIVKEDWIKGYRDQFLFLLNDFSIMRSPATKIVQSAKKDNPTPEVARQYLQQVKDFFSSYKPTFEDSLKIASVLTHPDKYNILRLFTYNYYNFKKIPKDPKIGGEEIRNIISDLVRLKLLTIITEKQNEWIFLLSDVDVNLFFPEYLLEKIRKEFADGKIKKEIALKHLELLEKAYVKSRVKE